MSAEEVAECSDMLQAIGFSSKEAARAIKAVGANVERAVEYLSSEQDQNDEPGAEAPLLIQAPVIVARPTSSTASIVNSKPSGLTPQQQLQAQSAIEAMGIDAESAQTAVEHFGLNTEAALNWIFDGMPQSGLGNRSSQADSPNMARDIESQNLIHRAVFVKDFDALRQYCRYGDLINSRDAHGATPLQLAHRLDYAEVINFLLENGADPRLPNKSGWTVLQEATLLRQHAIVMDLYLHQLMLKNKEWENSLPSLIAALEQMPDFYMEIKWEISSWVPFLARMAPNDTFQIYKKGGLLRFDSNAQSSSQQSRRVSFLFSVDHGLGAASRSQNESRSVFLVDFENGHFEDALLQFRNPPYEMIEREVNYMMNNEVGKSEIMVDRAQYRPKNGLFGGQKEERIADQWDCKLGEIAGLRFQIANKADSASAKSEKEIPTFDEYFDRNVSAADEAKDIVSIDREIEATVWLTDQFPLARESITTIMDIVGPASPDLARVKQIFQTAMPPGFPVRLEVPVMPAITACVVFSTFRQEQCDDSMFLIPAHFRQRL